MIKETMKRKRPSFNESYYGYDSFSALLTDAEKHKLVVLRRDERSGSAFNHHRSNRNRTPK